jgi:tRNA dimethylallyltransferase
MTIAAVTRAEPSIAIAAAKRPRVGFIVGPTGAGKTTIALAVAERIAAEIVNADSRQLYRAMDIGTAKPSPEELRRVPHHLIDIRDPDDPLDVAAFTELARAAIAEITGRGRPVIVVGGSGLYLRVLRAGIFAGPPADATIRARLSKAADDHGLRVLHTRLAAIDPAAAARISPNDRIRIVRALEVFELTGEPISALQARHHFGPQPYTSLTVGVTRPRELLYAAIDRRFDDMIEAGLIDEVRRLMRAGYDAAALSRTTGYREVAAYLRGELDRAAAVDRAKRESRRLAKRQLTWFRAEPDIIWIDAGAGADRAIELFGAFFERRTELSG